jgi:hypothetical protein
MTEETEAPKYDADRLVRVYIKIRDAKAQLKTEFDEAAGRLDEQMDAVEAELLNLCKATGQDGGRTDHGTFTRTVKTRYWTSDWQSMYEFIKDHNALELLEQRVSQGNMKKFLLDNPQELPAGLNVDSKYAITVRRPTK